MRNQRPQALAPRTELNKTRNECLRHGYGGEQEDVGRDRTKDEHEPELLHMGVMHADGELLKLRLDPSSAADDGIRILRRSTVRKGDNLRATISVTEESLCCLHRRLSGSGVMRIIRLFSDVNSYSPDCQEGKERSKSQ